MEQLAIEVKTKMERTIDSLKSVLSTLRTGRANAMILDRVEADYYGSPTPINQIASINIPEPRQIVVKPYDRNDIKSIAAAISGSDLGLNPIVEADVIRLIVPSLTEDRRKELSKQARKHAEDAKIAVRNIRRDAIDNLKRDDSYSEDMVRRIEVDIQKVTDEINKNIDEITQNKEKEIMSV